MKKSKVLVLVIVLVLILVIGAGAAFAYFKTDMFMSDQDMFLKYATQLLSDNGLGSDQLDEYFSKKLENKYYSDGMMSFNFSTTDSSLKDQIKNVNEMKITVKGLRDIPNKQNQVDVSINYTSDVNTPFTVKQDGTVVGLQADFLSSKYLSYDIKTLLEELDVSEEVDTTVDKLKELDLTKEDLNVLYNNLTEVVNSNLEKTDFTKLEDGSGYQVKMTVQKLVDIFSQMLDKISEDPKISSVIDNSQVEELKQELESVDLGEYANKEIVAKVFVEDKKTIGFEIVFENSSLRIMKNVLDNNKLTYQVDVTLNSEEIGNPITGSVNLTYDGLSTMENVEEKCSINLDGLGDGVTYSYIVTNDVSFNTNTSFEDLTENNSILLSSSKYSDENKLELVYAMLDRIVENTQNNMEELGLEFDQNPLFSIIPGTAGLVNSGALDSLM